MSFNLAAIYQAAPGNESEVESHLDSMLVPTRAEPGCENYQAFRSKDDGRTFLLVERYTSEVDFEAHKNSPHFDRHIRNGVWGLLESRNVIFGEELGG
ncbi:MAG: putative quinol monooxygenase [Acidimicrobiia bacterium]